MKHLLSAGDLSRDEALAVLDTAERLDEALTGREVKKLPTLRGHTVVNVFYESSTRTSSHPSVSVSRTRTLSSSAVGRFLPT